MGSTDILPKHRASCHCGTVVLELDLPEGIVDPRRCDCSICRRKGAIAASVPLAGLRVVAGADRLSLYQFNTHTAKHYFCSVCGIYTHHQRRSNPEEYGYNIACLEGLNPFDLGEVPTLDGVNHPSDRMPGGTIDTHEDTRAHEKLPSEPEIRIEPGREGDVPVILELIRGLAEYEKLADQVVATEAELRRSLFGETPAAEVLLAYAGPGAAGFALFFPTFSTFLGRPGLYLEDLFVLPEWRGQGIGRRLFNAVAATAARRRYGRLEWSVLDWNAPAIDFYERQGATHLAEWQLYRLSGPALERFAAAPDA